jgi:hypothetical protein
MSLETVMPVEPVSSTKRLGWANPEPSLKATSIFRGPFALAVTGRVTVCVP